MPSAQFLFARRLAPPTWPAATAEEPVSLMDIGPTALSTARLQPETKLDGQSLLPHLTQSGKTTARDLLFFGGWHVGVNFACGIQQRHADGSHYLYAYNCSSPVNELYDLTANDPENLAQKPEHSALHKQMVERLGEALQKDLRWVGYWSEFRIAKYFDLPKSTGDVQLSGQTS